MDGICPMVGGACLGEKCIFMRNAGCAVILGAKYAEQAQKQAEQNSAQLAEIEAAVLSLARR